jgi:hypothetical protein
MKTSTIIRLFCRDEYGESFGMPEWTIRPFRAAGFLHATNGHVIVWRPATKRDSRFPLLEKDRARAIREGHPGAKACRRAWPKTKARFHERTLMGSVYSLRFPGTPGLYVNAVYRDRIARFARHLLAPPPRYAAPADWDKPIYFVCGSWSGALMGLRYGPDAE